MWRALPILLSLALVLQPALAQTLAPGKPAGIQPAQHITYRQGFIAASVVAVALAFTLPSSTPTTGTAATSTATTG